MTVDLAEELCRAALATRGTKRVEVLCALVEASDGGCPNASAALVKCLEAAGDGPSDPLHRLFSMRAAMPQETLH